MYVKAVMAIMDKIILIYYFVILIVLLLEDIVIQVIHVFSLLQGMRDKD